MNDKITLKLEGLKRVSAVGYPEPEDGGYDDCEPVFFLTDDMCFRLGTYDFREQTFRSDNGYGGEAWEKDEIIAWAYWMDDDNENGEGVTVSEI